MPFERLDGSPLDALRLDQRPADGFRFDLVEGFAYRDPVTGDRFTVPGGASGLRGSDLASVPTALWSFIASYGRQSAPALLHDHRSLVASELARTDRRAALAQRRGDDRVFRTALREQRVPLLRAWLMWAWVSADREREFNGWLGRLFLVQGIVGALAVVTGLVLAWWQPAWLLLLVAAAVAAVCWGRLAPLQLVLAFGTGLLAPLVVGQLAVLAPFRLVEAIVELVTGGDPGGVVRPTVAASGEDQGQP
ncbi:DUF1353 domain-containing protein [Agromyces larvae]|uniref:DUF1353 domain-containing protein n=1 Tax=Agromyces larvae TaxID=2929802 RepID=A0ABY4BU97_9MICO|nr:DUF1353 domain-containing protein [Agromyces larvae]UOE42786.1 DUF1353 domain-containing protein [Agromyces larvae]